MPGINLSIIQLLGLGALMLLIILLLLLWWKYDQRKKEIDFVDGEFESEAKK